VISSSSVIYLPTSSPTDYVRRLSFRRWFLIPLLYRSAKQKNHLPMVLQTKFARHKKKIPAWNLSTDFYSVGDIVIYRRLLTVGKSVGECMKYRPNISVCEFVGKCGSNADGLSPSIRLSVSVYNTDRIYPSVKASVNATVRCRRINFVGKTLGNSFSKFVFKKIFRLYNIKLYKLMVIQTNYATKIYIKHQKKKIKVK